jgi:hypothetical protein
MGPRLQRDLKAFLVDWAPAATLNRVHNVGKRAASLRWSPAIHKLLASLSNTAKVLQSHTYFYHNRLGWKETKSLKSNEGMTRQLLWLCLASSRRILRASARMHGLFFFRQVIEQRRSRCRTLVTIYIQQRLVSQNSGGLYA